MKHSYSFLKYYLTNCSRAVTLKNLSAGKHRGVQNKNAPVKYLSFSLSSSNNTLNIPNPAYKVFENLVDGPLLLFEEASWRLIGWYKKALEGDRITVYHLGTQDTTVIWKTSSNNQPYGSLSKQYPADTSGSADQPTSTDQPNPFGSDTEAQNPNNVPGNQTDGSQHPPDPSVSADPPTSTNQANQSGLTGPPTSTDQANQSVSADPPTSTDQANQSGLTGPPTSTDQANQSVSADPPTSTDQSDQSVLTDPPTSTDQANQSGSTDPSTSTSQANQSGSETGVPNNVQGATINSVLEATTAAMDIRCEITASGIDGDVAVRILDQFHSGTRNLVADLQDAICPRNSSIHNVGDGSVIIQLRVKTIEALEELWERYKNGDLKNALERVLITDEIRKLGKTIEMVVTMSKEQNLDAQSFLYELTQHQEKGNPDEQPEAVPPEILARGPQAQSAYKQALKSGTFRDPRLPVVVVGQSGSGKTSLLRSLNGEKFKSSEDSTVGAKIQRSLAKVDCDWEQNEKNQDLLYNHCIAMEIVKHLKKPAQPNLDNEDEINSSDNIIIMEDNDTTQDVDNVENQDHFDKQELLPDEVAMYTETVLENPDVEKQMENYLFFNTLDFAGQSVYSVTHPAFLSPKAIYLLVHSLSSRQWPIRTQ